VLVWVHLFAQKLLASLPSTARFELASHTVELCCVGHAWFFRSPHARAQLVVKWCSRYVPAAHGVHVLLPAYPPLQTQAAATMLPAGEDDCVGHAEHATLPATALYVSALHCEHVPPSTPLRPALHLQAATAMLPTDDIEPVGHAAHRAIPSEFLYVPATHATHDAPPLPV